jgi:hypothetical protein
MWVLSVLLLFLANPAAGEVACTHTSKNSIGSIAEMSEFLNLQGKFVRECAESEILDPILDPYRKQDLAVSLCQISNDCLNFLRAEAARISGRPLDYYLSLTATAIWSDITMQSGRTRRPPPQLKDFPLAEDPEVLFAKAKEQAMQQSHLSKNEKVKFACAALVAAVGPGKVKVFSVGKSALSVEKIYRTHDVEKILKKNRLPSQVKERFLKWSQEVEAKGLKEVKKTPGYHDEPLAGHPGWHSVRLNDGFRACYQLVVQNGLEVIEVFSITNDHKNYCRK